MARLTVSDLGEVELVEQILDKLSVPNSDVQIGPGDDAAVLGIGGSVVLTTDSQHEGIHYFAEWIAPEVLGRRAIAVNASDLGAMGARPRGFLVALALPISTELDWVISLAEGLREGAERFGASILGGDVAAVADRVSINVTALGEIERNTEPVELQREPGALLPDGQADLERLGRCLRLVISHRQFLKHASTHFSILGLRLHLVVA